MNNDWDLGAVVRRWFNRKSLSPPLVNVIDPNQGDPSSNLQNEQRPTCHNNPSYENCTGLSSQAFDSQNNDHSTSQVVVQNTSMAEVPCMQAEWKAVHKRKNRERITQEHETVSLTDGFVWKKYGQRVVKGSLYPRDYYKCNSGHACPAKYVVAYYGFHNHILFPDGTSSCCSGRENAHKIKSYTGNKVDELRLLFFNLKSNEQVVWQAYETSGSA